MQIADLRIENFRGIRTGHILFGPHTVSIGQNNCGKTTVIEALAVLSGPDRMVRDLAEHEVILLPDDRLNASGSAHPKSLRALQGRRKPQVLLRDERHLGRRTPRVRERESLLHAAQ